MSTTYYKRYRMEFDFRRATVPDPQLPDGYDWVPWHHALGPIHARVKHECFRDEMDSHVFVSLSDLPGCERLMTEISGHKGFVRGATWIVRFVGNEFHAPVPCGTIQGLRVSKRLGSVQNVGVVAEHRGQGLGKALVLQALLGFRGAGLQRVRLEVTSANKPAVQLYRRLGFRHVSTNYREVHTPVLAPKPTRELAASI